MVGRRGKDELSSDDFWEVSHAASGLIAYGCYVGSQHLQDDWTRMQFNRELAYYARRIVNDVEERRLNPEEGLAEIRAEKQGLWSQSQQLLGMIGGTGQMIGGAGICYASAGIACGLLGAPMIAHGANNFYEASRNLVESRSDVEGPVRRAYQSGARALGMSAREGNMAYLSSDIAMSGASLIRPVLKKDSWRLFRYLSSDKELAFRQMSAPALTLEQLLNTQTGKSLHDEYKNKPD
nr:DUF4225 domain-containing protein [uncultured Pseudomonas sp.]